MSKISKLETYLKKYTENKILRSSILAVPYIGSSLDFLITFDIQKKSIKRFESFIEELSLRTKKLDENKIDYDFLESEEFYDLFTQISNNVTKTRLDEKIKAYSHILSSSFTKEDNGKMRPEDVVSVIANLTENNIFWIRKIYHYFNTKNPETINKTIIFQAKSFSDISEGSSVLGLLGLSNSNLIIKHPAKATSHISGISYTITPMFMIVRKFLISESSKENVTKRK